MKRRALAVLGAGMLALAATAQPAAPRAAPAAASGAQDFSVAERLLLMSNQMAAVPPGTSLRYRFEHMGSRDAPWQDGVRVALGPRADGSCCVAKGEFLSGARRIAQPDVDDPEGNPVVLYFLERDIQDMRDATQGATAYFRKRIRMALYQGARVQPVAARYLGKPVSAQQIALTPYENDPNRARFEAYLSKRYLFTLSPDVPGGVVQLRASVPAAATASPLVDDMLTLEGAALP